MKPCLKPLVVPFPTFCNMIGVGETKGHDLINHGFDVVNSDGEVKHYEFESYLEGNRRQVVVESAEAYVALKREEAENRPAKKHVESARRRRAEAGGDNA